MSHVMPFLFVHEGDVFVYILHLVQLPSFNLISKIMGMVLMTLLSNFWAWLY